MSEKSLQSTFSVDDSPPFRLYGSLWLLLTASLLVELLAPTAFRALFVRLDATLGGQVIGALLYTALLLALLGSVGGLLLLWSDIETPTADGLVSATGAVTLLSLVVTYWLHRRLDLPDVPWDIIELLLVAGIGMVGLGVGYARATDTTLHLERPDAAESRVAVLAVGATTLLGVAVVVLYGLRTDPMFAPVGGIGFAPRLDVATVLFDVGLPSLVTGVGMGVLYFGVIQESLLGSEGPASAIAAVTALLGGSATAITVLRLVRALSNQLLTAVTVARLSVVLALVAPRLVAVLEAALEGPAPPLVGAVVGTLTIGVLLAVTALGPGTLAFALSGLSLTLAAAIAAVAYERTRSVWVAAAGVATFLIAVNPVIVQYFAQFV